MNVRELYEQLLEGNSFVLEFSSRNDFLSIFSQLRSIKSRFDAQMRALSGNSISDGKVIRTEQVAGNETAYKFSLADRKVIDRIQFKILDIIPDTPVNEAGVQLELPEPSASGDLELETVSAIDAIDAIERNGKVDTGNGNNS